MSVQIQKRKPFDPLAEWPFLNTNRGERIASSPACRLPSLRSGRRRGEVASLTVGALCLDETNHYVCVEGKHAKSGRAATLPLRGDLAGDLRKHIARLADDGRTAPDTPLFNVGRNFLRTSNLDLAAAGIAKRDAQGRTVDVHCLRHTFATLLARNGVSPSVAQKLMRHSDIRLTMNTYTHLDLADTAGAVAALPAR